MTVNEKINKMKLCFFCREGNKYGYRYTFSEQDADLHEKMQYHSDNGKSWKPMNSHKDYELHLRWIKILSLNEK